MQSLIAPNSTILIAEDDDDGRGMMQTLLRLKGYDVVGARDGMQAIDLALAKTPDLILLDLELPLLNGLAVTESLRRLSQFKQVPIVIVSGHDPRKYREAALAAGCVDYLLKPIDFEALEDILAASVPLSNAPVLHRQAKTA
jgi:two-component system cell cycle response regulator DivK